MLHPAILVQHKKINKIQTWRFADFLFLFIVLQQSFIIDFNCIIQPIQQNKLKFLLKIDVV